jgi:hypothetical protein
MIIQVAIVNQIFIENYLYLYHGYLFKIFRILI